MPYRAIASELQRQGYKLQGQGYDRDFMQYHEIIEGLKMKYQETVDSLRRSGVRVESKEDLNELDISVSFKWFAEIHGKLGRRAVVNPPSLINLSDFITQCSGTVNTHCT